MSEEIGNNKIIELFKIMKTIRLFEEEMENLFKKGYIRGSVHLYIGQEAIAAGVCGVLNKEDYIVSNHRGHGHCLAKGADPKYMAAELLGKERGYCGGKGGSMHITDYESGVLCANGIVGAGLPISVGAGLGLKLKQQKNVVVCFFGDGAWCEGVLHESLNLASIWKLPVIFVCENNEYAISTYYKNSIAATNLSDIANTYGIKSVIVNGNNVIEVFDAAKNAREEIMYDSQPIFIEAKTYRLLGHYIGDDQNYRNKENVTEKWKNEPLVVFEDWINQNHPDLKDFLKETEEEVQKVIKDAVQYAIDCPYPKVESATTHVFTYGPAWERRNICERDYSETSN